MLLIKTIGIVLLVLFCVFAGFLKSFSVRSRGKKLSVFCDGLDLLYEHIEQGNCELDKALKSAFSKCDFLNFKATASACKDQDLTAEDRETINSFFLSLGASPKKAECDRIKHCRIVMKQRRDTALADAQRSCKLWQTFGICIGLTLGILLI